jgi:putative transposase
MTNPTNSLMPIQTVTRLGDLDKIMINNDEYVWTHDEGDKRYFSLEKGDGRTIHFTVRDTEDMIERGDMVVIEDYYAPKLSKRRAVVGHETLFAMEDKKVQEALRKERWVQLAIRAKEEKKLKEDDGLPDAILRDYKKSIAAAMKRDGAKLQTTQAESKGKKGKESRDGDYLLGEIPPLRTLNDWIAKYVAAEYDISGLIDKRTGDKTPRFTEEERQLHAKFVLKYASRTKPTVRHLHRRMVASIRRLNRERPAAGKPKLRPLGETSFRMKIKKLPSFFKKAGREGKKRAQLYFNIVKAGVDKGIPLQRVEADEWTVELMTILEGTVVWDELTPEEREGLQKVRLFFSGVIDVATKCVLSFRVFVTAPNTESARTTLELTSRDKTFLAKAAGCRFPWEMKGKYRTIGIDNATWNKSNALRGTLSDAGVTDVFPPAREPYLRGTIERFFRTIAFLGLQEFSGRTFGSVIEKGREYNDERPPSIRTDQLAKIFIRLIVDVYHNTPHSGLWGATPRQAWLELTRDKKIPPAPTGFHRRNIYGTPAVRAITKQGIVYEDIQFQSDEIQRLRRDDEFVQVHIRVDRYDLSEISVIWKDGFLRVPATLKGLKGVSYWRWMKAKERLRIENRENLELVADDVADAIEWSANEAEAADAELELTSPVFTIADYKYEDEKAGRYIRTVELPSNLIDKKRGQAAALPANIAALFGPASVVNAAAEAATSSDRARETAILRAADAKASSNNTPDDEFGIID